MKSAFLSLLLLTGAFSCTAQSGYLGTRNVIGLEGFGNIPLVSGSLKQERFVKKGTELVSRKEIFNYGYNVFYLHNMSSRYSIGLEFNSKTGLLNSPVAYANRPDAIGVTEDSTWLRMESLTMQTTSALVKFEFYSKQGLGPVGFSQQVSVGYSITRPRDKTYHYSINEFGNDTKSESKWSAADSYYLPPGFGEFKAFTLIHGINMRLPVARNLAIDFGVKYCINLYLRPDNTTLNANYIPLVDYQILYNDIIRENIFSFNLKAGICYLF